MDYNSEEFDDRENKLLKEDEDSKRKHKELEERYKNLVEKKPLSMDLKESLAILQKVYSNKNGESYINERFHISEEKFSIDEDFEESDRIQKEINEEKSSETENSFQNEEENDKNEITENIESKEDNKETANFPEDGVFKAFYEDNIAPMLERPDFKEIRDFINNGNDFSDEKYEMMVKAFEEKTGISYSKLGSIIDNEKKQKENETESEIIQDEIEEEKELSYDDFMDGAKKMYAVPVKEEKENTEEKISRLYIGGALSGIVVLVVIFVLCSIW